MYLNIATIEIFYFVPVTEEIICNTMLFLYEFEGCEFYEAL